MARITVEDCLTKVDNRFELVLVSSKRARQLMTGNKDANIEWENDKATVVALREIEQGFVDASILEDDDHEDYFEEPTQKDFDQETELTALMGEVVAESPDMTSESETAAENQGDATAE